MSRPGRLLRELMRPDTARDVARRKLELAALARVREAFVARYPQLDESNVRDALAWQEKEIKKAMDEIALAFKEETP